MRKVYLLILLTQIGVASDETTKFGGSLNSTLNSDFKPTSDINKEFSLYSGVVVSATIPQLFKISSGLSYSKDLVGERVGEINDTSLSISRKIKDFNENLSLSGSASIFIPISKDSREVSYLNTGYRLSGVLNTKLPQIPNLTSIWALNFIQNFHNLEVTAYGQSNKQFVVSVSNEVTYYFLKRFNVNMNISYAKGFTYQGFIIDTISGGQALGYDASEKLSFAVGHGLSGNIFKPNGQDYNLSFFDPNRSKFYMEMNLVF
jgi:hypothetical protein